MYVNHQYLTEGRKQSQFLWFFVFTIIFLWELHQIFWQHQKSTNNLTALGESWQTIIFDVLHQQEL